MVDKWRVGVEWNRISQYFKTCLTDINGYGLKNVLVVLGIDSKMGLRKCLFH